MTSLQMLTKVLSSQRKGVGKPGDWGRISFSVENRANAGTDVLIESSQVGFSFDRKGRLKGIVNWKE